jgi:hypothetical protein
MQRKKLFTSRDDQELAQLVSQFGDENWMLISTQMSRVFTTRQCRDRWRNYLNPSLARSLWTEADDSRLIEAYNRMGNRWASLAALFPGRTCNFVRNRCLAVLRRSGKDCLAQSAAVTDSSEALVPQAERDQRFSLSDGTKLPSTEEEIIDLFLGRKLHVPDRETPTGDAEAGAK